MAVSTAAKMMNNPFSPAAVKTISSMAVLPKIFCAIDTPDLNAARRLAGNMHSVGCGLKLGLEFFNANGPQGIALIRKEYPDIALFLDLKCHDIPNTVAGAIRSIITLAPAFVTLHASGGHDMMRAASDAADEESMRLGIPAPALLAVTVLTSLDTQALESVGQDHNTAGQVLRLAKLTRDAGLPGIVCAGPDIAAVRKSIPAPFTLMVPGIRPAGSDVGDQKRVMTPPDALKAGATHLVIGRPITGAANPARAASDILKSL